MKTIIIESVDTLIFALIAVATIGGFGIGITHSLAIALFLASGAFLASAVLSGVWFCLSGTYHNTLAIRNHLERLK